MQQRLNFVPIVLLHFSLSRQCIFSFQPCLRFDEAETVFFKIPFRWIDDGDDCYVSLIVAVVRGACAGDVVDGYVGIERFLHVKNGVLGEVGY